MAGDAEARLAELVMAESPSSSMTRRSAALTEGA
jgi:hypothetical protein